MNTRIVIEKEQISRLQSAFDGGEKLFKEAVIPNPGACTSHPSAAFFDSGVD